MDRLESIASAFKNPALQTPEPTPVCPRLRRISLERPYPVAGYCMLAYPPGKLMTPSSAEYRTYCTTRHFSQCAWYRPSEAAADQAAQDAFQVAASLWAA
jgi:hypothetical protein